MANPSKAKGTAAETATVRYLFTRGITATRAPQHGNQDRGDVWAHPTAHGHRLMIEVKAGDQAANPSMGQVAKWQEETDAEAARVPDCDAAVLLLKRKGSADPATWPAWVRIGDIESWHNPDSQESEWAYQWVCLPFGDLINHLEVAP